MFDSLFQFLFGYRPLLFQQGEFRLDPSTGSYVAAAIGVLAIAAAVFAYRRAGIRGTLRHRIVLGGLRIATLALLLFCLFRPVLVVKAAVPQRNVIGVLLDDSKSMQIADWKGQPRAAFVREDFGSADRAVMKALSDKFLVRTFRFSSTLGRVGPADALTFAGAQTKLGTAVESARQELAGLPLVGLVVVSDGADTTEGSLTESLLGLKAESVPVFTVGVGAETRAKDIEIQRVTVPKTVLKGTSLLLDVVLAQSGYSGQTVTLDVEDEGRIIGSQQVQLPADGSQTAVRIRAMASEAGARVLHIRVPPQPGELVTQNNARDALMDVRDRREKILYFEGEPRFELKFIRRAVDDDKNLQVVALQRTAENKYLRLGVDNGDELIAGFPKSREELFAYRGLVLGSIEAGAFTGDQLRMISDFVDKRGGGLLMLGGPRAFSEGGYVGTPVADALPVTLTRAERGNSNAFTRLKVSPTRAGAAQAVTQIAATESASASRWNELPEVTSVNDLTAIKPGATVLLNGTDERRRTRIVLASQRYGRGKALAFPIQDSWLWQMHASIPVEDQTHENFWRQLLRTLVDGVPDEVEVQTTERVDPGEPVNVTAQVVDPTFVELNDAHVVAHVTRPNGSKLDVPLQWTGEHAGEYRGSFVSGDQGIYEVQVDAARAAKPIGTGMTRVRATPGDAEYFNATMDAARLRRIAEETGGRFYTPDTVARLPEDLQYAGRGVVTVEERDLWHMPLMLGLLVGLVCAEWGYRRKVGLA